MRSLACLALLAIGACTSLGGLSGGGDDAGADASDAASSADATPDGSLDEDAALPPGTIACPSTNVTCDVASNACCVTVYGYDAPAPRSFTKSTATCGVPQACTASYSGGAALGNAFTMTFEATCSKPSDCTMGVCCVMNSGNHVLKMACQAQCSGKILCDGDGLCGATKKCTAETDPVLVHVYDRFCF